MKQLSRESMADRPADDPGTEKAGWLRKKGSKWNTAFQKRWFVLWRDPMANQGAPYEISYYDGKKSKAANGTITLADAGFSVALPKKPEKGEPHCIVLTAMKDGKDREFVLAADTSGKLQGWLVTLRNLSYGVGRATMEMSSQAPTLDELGFNHGDIELSSPSSPLAAARQSVVGGGNAVAGSMISSIMELLDKDGDGFLNYKELAGLSQVRDTPIPLAVFEEMAALTGAQVEEGIDAMQVIRAESCMWRVHLL